MFGLLSKKLSSAVSFLSNKFSLTEKDVKKARDQVRDALLESDVPYEAVESFLAEVDLEGVSNKSKGSLKPGQVLVKAVHDKLVSFLGGNSGSGFKFQRKSVVVMMGLQGSGKTTTIAKLARFAFEQAKSKDKPWKILVASTDFRRPAAMDQLEVLAKQVGCQFFRPTGKDALEAAKSALEAYWSGGYDLLLLDTAGRLHVESELLCELKEIVNLVKPRYRVMILDAMTGQESLSVAREFQQNTGFDFAILTKMDSDARGGAAFAFSYSLKKPIRFIGMGERDGDLEQFRAERAAQRILGMGDVVSLAEKAEKVVQKEDQKSLLKSFTSGRFTLEDFAKQLGMVSKLGSLSKIAKHLPGMSGANVSGDALEKGEKEMSRFRAVINSMTVKERRFPKVLDASRRKRVAQGAGVSVEDVNIMLSRFEQSRQYAKLLGKSGIGRLLKFRG